MSKAEINYDTLYTCQKYLVSLIASSFTHCPPKPLPPDITWEMVYQSAKAQGVSILAFSVVQDLLENSSELYQRWKTTCDQVLLMTLTQAYEIDRITKRFSEEHIRFLWLKGFWMKDLYAQIGFREMSDLDLLVEPEKLQPLQTIMAELGYTPEVLGENIHDNYVKDPYVKVELHKSLVPDDAMNHQIYLYYSDLWERLIPDKQNPCMYHMSLEDFYIFHLVHFAKHCNWAGYGIRPMMDIYIYLKRYRDQMDWLYLERELKKIGMLEFSRTAKELTCRWFAPELATGKVSEQALMEMEEGCFFSGVHGSVLGKCIRLARETNTDNSFFGKIQYVFHRLWADPGHIQSVYHPAKQHPILIPFFRIYRMFTMPVKKKEFVKKELLLTLFRKNK